MKKVYGFHLSVWVYILFMYFTQGTFSFMALNVFLAWLPIVFLMTDLFHLASLRIYQPGGHFLDDSNAWWSYLLLLLPILLMVFVGMVQVFKIISAVKLQMIQKISGIVLLSVLSSIAVYIGRFDRVHSVELFIHPMTVLKLLIGNWSVGKFQFVLMFSILQLGIWGLIYFLPHVFQEE